MSTINPLKLIVIVASLGVMFTLMATSCGKLTGDECGPFPSKFKVTDMSASEKFVVGYDELNRNLELSAIEADTLAFDRFAIEIFPITEAIFASQFTFPTFHLIQPAFACSPAIPVSAGNITNIRITADIDFNEVYPAGSNLAELFDVHSLYLKDGPDRLTLPEFLEEKPAVPDLFVLLLKEGPEDQSELRFTVEYHQEGELLNEFNYTTRSLVITR